jgi:hypothetical protein
MIRGRWSTVAEPCEGCQPTLFNDASPARGEVHGQPAALSRLGGHEHELGIDAAFARALIMRPPTNDKNHTDCDGSAAGIAWMKRRAPRQHRRCIASAPKAETYEIKVDG